MKTAELQELAIKALEDMKATDILNIDVRDITSITDNMIVATGRSSRHVVSSAQKVAEAAKLAGNPALSISGESEGEWVLVDLGDVIVHLMQAETRSFYDLESLWASTENTINRAS